MANEDQSVQLLMRWRNGDETAAEEIFERYVDRLSRLARKHLSAKMQRRVDADDVVQSAYRSFFRHARDGDRYELRRSGDLWRLLAGVTINKVRGQVEFHQAAKRSISEEGSIQEGGEYSSTISPVALAREPTVEEAAAVTDEVEAIMLQLDPIERRVLELRLNERSTEEIAAEVSRSTRTVRRTLERIRQILTERFS